VLDGFDDLNLLRNSGIMGQHIRESLSAGNNVFRLFLEQDEEIPVVWHQPPQESWHGNSLPPKERIGSVGSVTEQRTMRQGGSH
jgi:hypothetical protein